MQEPTPDDLQASETPFARALRDYLLALQLPHSHKQLTRSHIMMNVHEGQVV